MAGRHHIHVTVEDEGARVFLRAAAVRLPASDHIEPFVEGNQVVAKSRVRFQFFAPRAHNFGCAAECGQLFSVEMLRGLFLSRKARELYKTGQEGRHFVLEGVNLGRDFLYDRVHGPPSSA